MTTENFSPLKYDTLSDLPPALTADVYAFSQWLFNPLLHMVGVVLRGQLSKDDEDDESHWGMAMPIGAHDTLQMRFAPRGNVAKFTQCRAEDFDELPVFSLAARLKSPDGVRTVLATLWRMASVATANAVFPAIFQMHAVSTAGVNVLPLGLFRFHDPTRSLPEKKRSTRPRFHTTDQRNCRTLMGATRTLMDYQNGPVEYGCVTLALWDVVKELQGKEAHCYEFEQGEDTEDLVKCYATYGRAHNSVFQEVVDDIGYEKAIMLWMNAVSITKALALEGIVQHRGEHRQKHSIFCGAVPDVLVRPSGYTFAVALAVRLATAPELLQDQGITLPGGTAQDAAAAAEVRMLFEESWEPLQSGSGPARFAIDCVIADFFRYVRSRIGEAKNALKEWKELQERVRHWQRLGSRCVLEIFGMTPNESQGRMAPVVDYGVVTVNTAFAEARQRHREDQAKACGSGPVENALQFAEGAYAGDRAHLLDAINAVEDWVRSGRVRPHDFEEPTARDSELQQLAAIRRGEAPEHDTQEFFNARRMALEYVIREEQHIGNVVAMAADMQRFAYDDVLHSAIENGVEVTDVVVSQLWMECHSISYFHAAATAGALLCNSNHWLSSLGRLKGFTAYMTSDQSLVTCVSCAQRVTLLQSAVFGFRHTSCLRCSGVRCLACATAWVARGGKERSCPACAG